MKKIGILVLSMAYLVSCKGSEQAVPEEPKVKAPNIIFILTDDLGYGDLGILYQNKRAEDSMPFHSTPNLDRIAHEGILLTRHYVPAPVCAPSRASLLLGVHQGHASIRDNQFDKALSQNHNLASVLKEAGYATGLIGKWGLQGKNGETPEEWPSFPTKVGFDHFFGYVRHVDGHNHYPAHEARKRSAMELYHGTEEISNKLKGSYTTDLFTAAAKKWITDQAEKNPDQPFFLELAYDTPHAALQVAAAPYPAGAGKDGGLQWIGEEGRFINTAEESIDDYIHPDYANMDWPEPQKRFASMVRRIDTAVNDVLQLLEDLGIQEETLVVFTSDNGPHDESYGYGTLDPTFFDSYGNMDGIKRDTWEGGIRVPTIAYWPGHINPGSINDTPTGFHDWLPTFTELAGIPAPARTDGVSLVPILTGNGDREEGIVYIEYFNNGSTPDYSEFHSTHQGLQRGQMQVIYVGGYKGIRTNIKSEADDFRIYDTQKDAGETINLALAENQAGKEDFFKDLQQKMKNRVLQVRRPDSSAVRPYDEAPVPAVEFTGTEAGLKYELFNVPTPYTPDPTTLDEEPIATGEVESFDLRIAEETDNIVISYKGMLRVPETGNYTFSLATDHGALMRIHDITLLEADKGYENGNSISADIILEAGLHPINLVYARGTEGTPTLEVTWSGPGVPEQPVTAKNLVY